MVLAGQQQPLPALPFTSLVALALKHCRTPSLQIVTVTKACCCTLQVPLSQEELEGQAKVDKLALGVAGGFRCRARTCLSWCSIRLRLSRFVNPLMQCIAASSAVCSSRIAAACLGAASAYPG